MIILRGYPFHDDLEKAARDEIHLAGCVIMGNANYHCRSCGKDFHIEDVEIECENPKVAEYARLKMSEFEGLIRNSKCLGFEEIKEKLMFDDRECDAFINRLAQIGYISGLEELISREITP